MVIEAWTRGHPAQHLRSLRKDRAEKSRPNRSSAGCTTCINGLFNGVDGVFAPYSGVAFMPSIAVDLRKGIDETEAREQPIYLLHRLAEETGLTSEARRVDV